IVVTDTDSERLVTLAKKYKTLKVVEPADIFAADVDIFAPCALAGALSPHTVQSLKARLVVGGANNQLSNPSVEGLLYSSGIVYIPDYIANAGGFMSVVHEYE
ncbi:MAG: amino acid dehydrogenase, partial [Gallionella sp.]|nr:amino acid dehydrogenase [Gallionella sp.]